jgi:hypothetical protein
MSEATEIRIWRTVSISNIQLPKPLTEANPTFTSFKSIIFIYSTRLILVKLVILLPIRLPSVFGIIFYYEVHVIVPLPVNLYTLLPDTLGSE